MIQIKIKLKDRVEYKGKKFALSYKSGKTFGAVYEVYRQTKTRLYYWHLEERRVLENWDISIKDFEKGLRDNDWKIIN